MTSHPPDNQPLRASSKDVDQQSPQGLNPHFAEPSASIPATTNAPPNGRSTAASGDGVAQPSTPAEASVQNSRMMADPRPQDRPSPANLSVGDRTKHAGVSRYTFRRVWHHTQVFGRFLAHIMTDTWWTEIAALFFSTGCLVAITTLLIVYAGKTLSQLPEWISFNALIATLATASKSSLIFAVAATMAQAKWSWFKARSRPLTDMQMIDEASRGPLGAVFVLINRVMISPIGLGTVIVVLALALDPFIQQVLQYPSERRVDPLLLATTRRSRAVQNYVGYSADNNGAYFSTSMQDSIYAGVYSTHIRQFERTPACPTGNCTWVSFQSAEFCYKCANITEEVRTTGLNRSFEDIFNDGKNLTEKATILLPEGESLEITVTGTFDESGSHGRAALTYSPTWLVSPSKASDLTTYLAEPHDYQGVSNPLLALGYARFSLTSGGRMSDGLMVSQCLLSPCSQTYNITVSSGVTDVEIIVQDYGVLYANQSIVRSGIYESTVLCWRPEGSTPDDINHQYFSNLGIYIDRARHAWCAIYSEQTGLDGLAPIQQGIQPTWVNAILEPLSGNVTYAYQDTVLTPKGVVQNPEWSSDTLRHIDLVGGLAAVLPNVTAALTSSLLNPYTSSTEVRPEDSPVELVAGTTWRETPIVRIRWGWMALPFGLEVCGIILLIWTFLETRRHRTPLWKESSLAPLYHGLENPEDEPFLGGPHVGCEQLIQSEMEAIAVKTHVQLMAAASDGQRPRWLLLRKVVGLGAAQKQDETEVSSDEQEPNGLMPPRGQSYRMASMNASGRQ